MKTNLDIETLDAFLHRPGINIAGICKEAGVTIQYVLRCLSDKRPPGKKAWTKLHSVLIKYGWTDQKS